MVPAGNLPPQFTLALSRVSIPTSPQPLKNYFWNTINSTSIHLVFPQDQDTLTYCRLALCLWPKFTNLHLTFWEIGLLQRQGREVWTSRCTCQLSEHSCPFASSYSESHPHHQHRLISNIIEHVLCTRQQTVCFTGIVSSNPTAHLGGYTIIFPILQRRKLRFRQNK